MLSLLWLYRLGLTPTDKDSRLDLIDVRVYTRLMVEWLHAMTLLSLESTI